MLLKDSRAGLRPAPCQTYAPVGLKADSEGSTGVSPEGCAAKKTITLKAPNVQRALNTWGLQSTREFAWRGTSEFVVEN